MGAEPYEYFVPYQEDPAAALAELRERVFASGEYNGAEQNPATPEEAFESSAPDGTRSILDIAYIAMDPDYGCAAPLKRDELLDLFGTEQPTREHVERATRLYDTIARGMARYLTVYGDGKPTEYFFVGYSYD